MPTPSNPALLLSIHDVSPRFEAEIDRLLDLLRPFAGNRLAMLVVPDHWGGAPIVPGSGFATRLRRWADDGVEMFLHGFYHRDSADHEGVANRLRAKWMTAGEGEFLGISRRQASEHIEAGRDLITSVIGRDIDGFVAPAWLYGQGALDALRDCRIALAEDHMRVWSPIQERDLARGPVITWASRSKPRLASSLVAAAVLRQMPMRVLRVGVHPPDGRHPAIVQSIEATLSKATASRRVAAYGDLLAA